MPVLGGKANAVSSKLTQANSSSISSAAPRDHCVVQKFFKKLASSTVMPAAINYRLSVKEQGTEDTSSVKILSVSLSPSIN